MPTQVTSNTKATPIDGPERADAPAVDADARRQHAPEDRGAEAAKLLHGPEWIDQISDRREHVRMVAGLSRVLWHLVYSCDVISYPDLEDERDLLAFQALADTLAGHASVLTYLDAIE